MMSEDSMKPITVDAKKYLSIDDFAELLGVSKHTTNTWRVNGTGPKFIKLGRRVLYALPDVEEWLNSKKQRSTVG